LGIPPPPPHDLVALDIGLVNLLSLLAQEEEEEQIKQEIEKGEFQQMHTNEVSKEGKIFEEIF